METILFKCQRKVQSLDQPQKSQVFQRTIQTQWTTSKIVSQVARLWFYILKKMNNRADILPIKD